ncbi:MAG: hypothetical protein QXW97_02345 [Candidatus Pacearchaeota archaeon]
MSRKRESIQEKIDYLLKKVISEFNIKLNQEDYPSVKISNSVGYSPILNHISIRRLDQYDGDILGEEAIGHVLRRNLRQYALQNRLDKEKKTLVGRLKRTFGIYLPEKADFEDDDSDVAEFFGYIGRKMLKKIADPKDKIRFDIKREPVIVPQDYKKHHEIGYKFAEQIDLSKIKDFNTFFSLSPEEVRARFFRPDPQYELDKPIEQVKSKKNLEDMLKFLIPGIFFILLISFLSKLEMTGYVTSIEPTNKKSYLLIITFISLSLIIFFVTLANKRKINKK